MQLYDAAEISSASDLWDDKHNGTDTCITYIALVAWMFKLWILILLDSYCLIRER